jgi:hypothetical protein
MELCTMCGGLLSYDATYFDDGERHCSMICATDDDEDDFDCMMGPDGQCGKAGSEECDWECSRNR